MNHLLNLTIVIIILMTLNILLAEMTEEEKERAEEHKNLASSIKSVGEFWLWEVAHCMK